MVDSCLSVAAPIASDRCIAATVDLRVYRLSAVKKTAYRIAEKCTVMLGALEGDALSLELRFSARTSDEDARAIERLFFQDLLDQELREQIGEETRPMRALVLAHAFSRTDLVRRDD
jgi:His-Xaa-Ser system protein HxsD